MEQIFKIGDVVKLKSGGVEMTVFSYDEKDKTYTCKWFQVSDTFSEDNEKVRDQLASCYFPENTLEKAK